MKSSALRLVLRVGASLAVLGFLATRVDLSALGDRLASVDARWIWGAAILSPFCIALLALRWRVFLASAGCKAPFLGLVRLVWAGQFFNTFLPGAVAGDVYKAVAVGKLLPGAKWQAGSTVLLDRICALLSLMLLAVVGAWSHREWLGITVASSISLPKWAPLLGVVVVLVLFSVLLAVVKLRALRKLWLEYAVQVWTPLRDGVCNWRSFLVAGGLSLCIHLANFGVFYVLGRALHLPLSFGDVLLVMPVVLIAAMLPLSVNGHGIRELILVEYFRSQGIGGSGVGGSAGAAVAVSLLYVANDLVWNLPGGIGLLLGGRGSSRQNL